jgi:hypothetical protein
VIVTVGAALSIVHVYEAGAPGLPEGLVARTANVWLPSLSPV